MPRQRLGCSGTPLVEELVVDSCFPGEVIDIVKDGLAQDFAVEVVQYGDPWDWRVTYLRRPTDAERGQLF